MRKISASKIYCRSRCAGWQQRQEDRSRRHQPKAEMQAALSGEGGLKEHVKVAMSRLERELVGRALQQTGGNVTHAARLLKISRKGLQLKMKELGLREGAGEKAD